MKRRLADRKRDTLRLEVLEERYLLSAVAGRHVFYNDSGFDGNDAGINAGDAAAIATDKSAYLADIQINIEQLTNNSTTDAYPRVSGPNIVWQGAGGTDGGTDYEIFWYDGSTIHQLTEDNQTDRYPQVSDLGVAWEQNVGSTKKIAFNDTVNATQYLGTPLGNFTEIFTLSDTRLTWEDAAETDFEILTWNNSGSPLNISNNTFTDRYADSDDDNVVWVEIDGATRRVRYFNGNSTTTVGTSQKAIYDPDVSGQNVAWEGFPDTSTTREIYFYNGNTVQILTNDSINDFDPQVSGNNVVWWNLNLGVSHIYFYDGSTVRRLSSTSRNQFPQIDGQNIVWQGKGAEGNDDEIFLWNGHRVFQITDNDVDDTAPQISGNHIVWQALTPGQGTTQEIFHATFTNTVLGPGSVTNYSKGINGVMVDIENPDDLTFALDDFTFRMSGQGLAANNTPSSWAAAPAPTGFTVLPDTPVAGTDRVEFLWPNNAIQDRYLEVIVEGNDAAGGFNTNTGLAASDIFFFGNKIGDDFTDYTTFFNTDATDEIDARNNQGVAFSVTNLYDFNRDFSVDATDQIIARNNQGFMPRISIGGGPLPPAPAPPAVAARGDAVDTAGVAAALNAPHVGSARTALATAPSALIRQRGSSPAGVARYLERLDAAHVAAAEPDADLVGVELPDDVLDGLLRALRDR